MSRLRKILNLPMLVTLFVATILSSNVAAQANGEALFKGNCANCHKPNKDATGPALQGWKDRQPEGWIYKWVANPAAQADPYATALKTKWKASGIMTAFPQLKKEEVDAIMSYVDGYTDPIPTTGDATAGAQKGADGNYLLFGILTLVFALAAFILLQVNSNLKRLTEVKAGIDRGEPVPFYRNKAYLMAGILTLFALGGYFTINGAINMGRQKNYQPEQPIFYSHQVHAGTNQISCLYCHGTAQDSKHAGIPSVNVCMNCHKSIAKYEGPDVLVTEDGKNVNGTAEIEKLYEYAGWNKETKTYNPDNNKDGVPDGAQPIPWVKIHNLPDHVYFNHSQHIKVGKQQCQTCHGNIQNMGEVYQYSDLSMGWCVNCHRESKVDFFNKKDSSGNKFYSIYEKFHKDIAAGKLDSVSVEKIGGTECQKCHY
jgi:mono/diheme cytochrome c family protein